MNRCETCRWWDQKPWGNEIVMRSWIGFGTCKAPCDTDPSAISPRVIDADCGYDASLRTTKDFGCTLHEGNTDELRG